MKSKSHPLKIQCGAFGEQEFTCYFDRLGNLEAVYAWFDREEIVNLRPELTDSWVVALEHAVKFPAENSPDEMALAKEKIENDMIAQDAHEGVG